MERMCSICQSVTYDDEVSICSVCGAELPPVDDQVIDDEAPEETLDELELDELELEESDEGSTPEPEETDSVEVIDLEPEPWSLPVRLNPRSRK